MANENEDVQQKNSNGNNSATDAMAVADNNKTTTIQQECTDEGDGADDEASKTVTTTITEVTTTTTESGDTANCARGNLNDLLADLCINGTSVERSTATTGFGDYTNIRATLGPSTYFEGIAASTTTITSTTQQLHSSTTNAPTQNSSFSFKHFLNSSSSALTAPSSTITSLDPIVSSTTSNTSTSSATASLQTSTGARPKVPQSASVSNTSIASLMTGGNITTVGGGGGSTDANNSINLSTKMKRSPRFSSFDSQASLAEYAGTSEGAESNLENAAPDFFTSRQSSSTSVNASASSQYVPRSYSNYDMPMPASANAHRRRMGAGGGGGGGLSATPNTTTNATKEARPTRLALNTTSAKLKLDLPIESAGGGNTRPPLSNNVSDYPQNAAALPDFVQDHWMDSWYAHEMHLSSPKSRSPILDFAETISNEAPLGAGNSAGGGSAAVGFRGFPMRDVDAAASCGGPNVINTGDGGAGGMGATESSGASSKMLPDFLSDGPIIHSSQRLADIAAGLPSNSIGSPDDPPMTSQLSRFRIENERLQRELNETRVALNEQTRRANELERQRKERDCKEFVAGGGRSQAAFEREAEEENNRRRTASGMAPPQNHITKLKQQVTQLTAEVETLRRENETLREEGAVGGCSTTSCDRSYATTTAAAAGMRGNSGVRPSRTQQLSRDLLRAASSAENNLRQLLTGVDNLRQMAANIENSELRSDYNVSPDLYSDFLDECEDYEDYEGGPAL